MRYRLAALAIVACLAAGCFRAETWTGTVYPDPGDIFNIVSLGVFSSRYGCAATAVNILAQLDALESGDYECGLRCEPRDSLFWNLPTCVKKERPVDPLSVRSQRDALWVLHEQCMAKVEALYQPRFLAILPFKLEEKLGLVSEEEESVYSAFTEAVECLRVTSTRISPPTIGMNVFEFEAVFNGNAKFLGLSSRLSALRGVGN